MQVLCKLKNYLHNGRGYQSKHHSEQYHICCLILFRIAERLYKKGSALFIQKQYNEFYPLLSLAEDSSG